MKHCLRLQEHSHSAEFEEESGRRASNKFFHASLTNCTPWAVIGCLGWSQRVWEWHGAHPVARETGLDDALAQPELAEALAEALLAAFDDRKTGISTNTFAKAHLGRPTSCLNTLHRPSPTVFDGQSCKWTGTGTSFQHILSSPIFHCF